MKHANIYKRLLRLEDDIKLLVSGRKQFPHDQVGEAVVRHFPEATPAGQGAFKRVYFLPRRGVIGVALKIARASAVKSDVAAYGALPPNVRNRWFAKIHHSTDHMLLQKWMEPIGSMVPRQPVRPA